MKKTLQNLFLLFLLFSYNAVSGQTNILFIGNSYTYTNDLPNMFSGLSANLGQNVVVSSKTNGGFTFQNHYNDPNTFTAIHQSVRDLVIIQGQSQEPSFPTSQVNTNTYPFAKRIADSVYASSPCTNLMYFSTWGRENGDPQWDSINTFDKMNSRLFNAYMRFADSSDAMLAPVSMAWKWVRDNYPTINLYVADGSHPSVEGTYLIACTIYASTFQETPVGATFYGGISQVNAEILQNAAAVSVLPNLELYHLHPVDIRTVSGFNWNLDANGLLTATSTSLNAEEEVWKVESERGLSGFMPESPFLISSL